MDEVRWNGSNMGEVQEFLSPLPNYHANFIGRMNSIRLILQGPEGDQPVDVSDSLRWDGSRVVVNG